MVLQWSKFETMRSILIVIAAVALSIIVVVMPRSLLKPRVVHPYSFTRDVGSFFRRSRSASRSEIKVKIPGAQLVPFVSPHQLVATPANLDFGTVDRWKDGQLPALEVRLCNKGDKPWQGTIRSTLPWLDISPTMLICPAGGEVTLTGRLTLAGKRLRPRLYKAADALLIEGNGQTLLQIGAQVTTRREVSCETEFAQL